MVRFRFLSGVVVLSLVATAAGAATSGLAAKELEFFESKIRPVLAESCYECHNSVDKKKGGLALDWKAPIVESGVIVPGKPGESDLIAAIAHASGYEPMPDKAPKLSKVTIKQFEEWIRMGAPDPRTTKPTKEDLAAQVDWPTVRDKRAQWWSFQPLRKTTPPLAEDPRWNEHAIDRYIAARMRKEGLTPQPEADPATLVRRLHLVLTGLPPEPGVVRAFVSDPSPTAYARLVDELLASPRFGERWARHWMDWYRYAETHGSEGDPPVPYAQVYRDYLVRALNADVPYDQLIREHLAGDLLAEPRINGELGLNESAIGPAQLRMVPHGFGVTNAYDEQIAFTDNQVDVLSKATLGLTVSCARCHNHKFDPISQKDFYRFYGVMVSSRPAVRDANSPERQQTNENEIAALKDKLRHALADHWLANLDEVGRRLEESILEDIPDTDPFAAWAATARLGDQEMRDALGIRAGQHVDRLAHNDQVRREATFHLDLRDPDSARKWFADGTGSEEVVSPAGSFAIASDGDRALSGIYPAGFYSHLITEKHGATLTTAVHQAAGRHNAVRGFGRAASARFAVRNYALSHGLLHPAPEFRDKLGWLRIGKYDYWNGEKGYHHIATAPETTFRPQGKRSWFGVLEIYAGDALPQETGAPLAAWHDKVTDITTRDDLKLAYREGLRRALQSWRDESIDDSHALLLDAALRHGILDHHLTNLPNQVRRQIARYRELEAAIPAPTRVAGVVEGEVWDQPLLERGDPRQEGEPVPRRFLEIFPGPDYPADASGRLELAEDILREDNPLAARVIVNRLWHHIFGRGLVASTDNFGRLGKEPTHPALLDHLALSLRASEWSLKSTIREIVLSRTFRSAGSSSAGNEARDPANLFLAHYPPRRMEAEVIHDSLQFVSTGRPGKRAIYLPVVRNKLEPFLATFNFPIPTTTVGARDLTNVPGQALTLLNGPRVNRSAEQWARRIRTDPGLAGEQAKVTRMFEQAFSRSPTSDELRACLSFLAGDRTARHDELLALRDELSRERNAMREQRETLIAPVRERLARTDRPTPPDLKPALAWDFEDGLIDRVSGLGGQILGNARVEGGALVLNGGCFLSESLPHSFHEKTLEVVVALADLDQSGGGALTIQTPDGSVFDSIVFAEKRSREWLAGSDHFNRTRDFGGARESAPADSPVHLTLVLGKDGATGLFRNGVAYGDSYKVREHVSYEAGKSRVAIGLRHGEGPRRGRMLLGRVLTARLYDRALTPKEIEAASAALRNQPTPGEIRAAMPAPQLREMKQLEARLAVVDGKLDALRKQLVNKPARDPWTRLAHALLNTKEFIYVR